jgi:hypothetical protein
MRHPEEQRASAGAGPDGDGRTAEVLGALPVAPIDPAFSKQVLRAARAELEVSRSGWKRAELFFARVLVPAALLACAAGWVYHFVSAAQRIYAGHG